jgi:hypothetical protein
VRRGSRTVGAVRISLLTLEEYSTHRSGFQRRGSPSKT